MKDLRAIIFDYGGTIDTEGLHWGEVLWKAYQKEEVPVSHEQFWEAYVYTERKLGNENLIQSSDNFMDVLRTKADIETKYLVDTHYWNTLEPTRRAVFEHIALDCYFYAREIIKKNIPVLESLSKQYPLVLVSNFYGNLDCVLEDFNLTRYFKTVIESAKIGVRKPDAAIFQKAIDFIGFAPEEILVVGDSEKNDINPAQSLGCNTFQLPSGETLNSLAIFLQKRS